MMRLPRCVSFSALVLGSVFGLALLESGTADAGRIRFSGSVRVAGPRAGVSARWARPGRPFFRPRVRVGRSWWSRGYYYPRPYYYYYYPYYPEYVPSYYGGTYYPVQPEQSVVAPGAVAVAPRRSLPVLGIGVFAGGTRVDDVDDSTDLGAMLRVRLGNGGLLLEGEIAKTTFKDDVRVDRRIGGSVLYEIGAENTFAPYLLIGGGVQQAEADGNFTTTQDFGELGVGLRVALSRNLHLTLDARAGRRQTIDSDQPIFLERSVSPPSNPGDTEDYTRARLAAVLNF
jgi:hypothetical protein